MTSAAWSSTIARLRLRLRLIDRARSESAFTLIETVLAAMLMLVVATALAGVLTSSIAAHTTARERTLAEQSANDQIESIRNLPYADVGIDCATGTPCNPPGDVDATIPLVRDGLTATISTQISYVGDPTPTSYATAANYKKVTVTITRDRDGKQLARGVTYVAPVSRAPFGGINKSIVNVQVMDYLPNSPLQGAVVTIDNGPDPMRTDLTDPNGLASFAAMTPTGPTEYYDLTASLGGYETLPADLPPASVAHLQVAPSQTAPTSQIRVFKPGTINVRVESSPGILYTAGTVTLQVTSSTPLNGSTSTFTTSTGLASVTIVGGQKVVPGVTYAIKALTTTPLCGTVAAPTWSNYPTDATTTATIVLGACPSGNLTVNVQQLGTGASGATVHLTGGPNNITVSPDPTTDASGNVTFSNVPAGTGYTLSATKLTNNASTTTAVTVAGPNNATITLPNPPVGSVAVNVKQLGFNILGANVTLSGGPYGISLSGTTNLSGNYTFSGTVPAGSGYTVTATSGIYSQTSSSFSVTAGATTNVNIALPSPANGSVAVNVKQLGVNQSGATVTLNGGPWGISLSGTTNATGDYTFSGNVPVGSGYTVTATQGTYSQTSVSFAVIASTTTNVNIVLPVPPNGSVAVNVKQLTFNQSGATVTIQGGPWNIGPITAATTTDGSGNTSFTNNIPAGAGYTVTATKGAYSQTSASFSVTAGSTTNVNVVLATPGNGTITVTVKWAGTNVSAAAVSLPTGTGPYDGFGLAGGTTNASGVYTFSNNVPAGTGYTIQVVKSGVTQTAIVNVTAGSTTNVTVNMPTATVNVNVQWAALNTPGATVTLSGGPMAISVNAVSNASGNVSFLNVPTSGTVMYTVTAVLAGQTGTTGATVAVTAPTTAVTVQMPTTTLTVNVKRSGTNQVNATVKLSGGPMGLGSITATTNASGNAVFNNVPRGAGYTVKAYGTPCTASPNGYLNSALTVAGAAQTLNAAYAVGTACPVP